MLKLVELECQNCKNVIEDLIEDGCVWENCKNCDGEMKKIIGTHSKHFSWSAAHILLLMMEED